MKRNAYELISRLEKAGFTWDEAMKLRRIEMTLQRWAEAECGDSNDYCSTCIERDEATDKPFRVTIPHHGGKTQRYAIPDREKGALKRLAGIMASHPDYVAYHQGDCRGCMLYLVPKASLAPGDKVDCVYTRGIAVCD